MATVNPLLQQIDAIAKEKGVEPIDGHVRPDAPGDGFSAGDGPGDGSAAAGAGGVTGTATSR